MNTQEETNYKFDILFAKLHEAVKEQEQLQEFNFEFDAEINKTILLFKDYQESLIRTTNLPPPQPRCNML